ncbi:hypothetical protein EB796_001751 [Bugula neritina]|uniref:CD80-like immunoglobulin C2-set domain-containing protein n=1 Tax=Bugula neritina TaxID=10212 RepID=A0A7J7KNZ0_BUGNE|nr:hypothetical protein EB796_001751 [Bugula neritina]
MYNKTSGIPQTLTLDTIEKNPDQYTLETGGYNLVVKKATTDDDTVFECEAGESKAARVYIYDEPDSITLDWEHSVNKAGAVSANQEYKLRCKTTNSYPPATHRYYKDGVELSNQTIVYTYNNNTETGYGDVTSFMPFTPTSSDVDGNINVRCEADLYIKKNVMSVSFGINVSEHLNTVSDIVAVYEVVDIVMYITRKESFNSEYINSFVIPLYNNHNYKFPTVSRLN